MLQKGTIDWKLPKALAGPQHQHDPRQSQHGYNHNHNQSQPEPLYQLFLPHPLSQRRIPHTQTPSQTPFLQKQHRTRNTPSQGRSRSCNSHRHHLCSSHTVTPRQQLAALQHLAGSPPLPSVAPRSSSSYQAISVRPKPPRISSSASASLSALLPATSMQRTPPPTEQSVQDIRAIVSAVVSPSPSPCHHAYASEAEGAVRSIQVLPNPNHRPQQVYEVELSCNPATVASAATASTAANRLLVIMPPPASLKLLRSEQKMTRSEAMVVRWLREDVARTIAAVSNKTPSPSPHTASSPTEGSGDEEDEEGGSKHVLPISSFVQAAPDSTLLLRCLPSPVPMPRPLPRPLKASGHSLSSSWGFNVYASPVGSPIAALDSQLTEKERQIVDFQAGKLMSQLAQLTAGSRKFGPALAVLSTTLDDAASAAAATQTWSTAFHSILESILRDGEDIAVSLAYPTIRRHFRRLGHILDTVTTPSLVIVDAMDDSNLLVHRQSPKTDGRAEPAQSIIATPQTTTASGSESEGDGDEDEGSGALSVTGLRDWSNCVFGDPLFATVFSEQPSAAFLRGFGNNGNSTGLSLQASSSKAAAAATTAGILAGEDHHHVRMLLYQCYHAVVQIVKGFYRPGRDQTTHELAARKRLTEILGKLEAVNLETLEANHRDSHEIIDQEDHNIGPKARLRHRRSSADIWPAKKARSDSGDEPPRGSSMQPGGERLGDD